MARNRRAAIDRGTEDFSTRGRTRGRARRIEPESDRLEICWSAGAARKVRLPILFSAEIFSRLRLSFFSAPRPPALSRSLRVLFRAPRSFALGFGAASWPAFFARAFCPAPTREAQIDRRMIKFSHKYARDLRRRGQCVRAARGITLRACGVI